MRIGTNHGSLSDRIMSRYGDTPMGMVESAMEFLRVARAESYHQIVLSMKSSNPQVMVQAYRLLVKTMQDEFGECYPLHLGVTEAGDGEDGRIKSAIGIGSLLEDGLGDTIRVSLTEDPELEIPVCRDIVKRYGSPSPTIFHPLEDGAKAPSRWEGDEDSYSIVKEETTGYRYADPSALEKQKEKSSMSNLSSPTGGQGAFPTGGQAAYKRRETFSIDNIGAHHVPIVVADLSKLETINAKDLQSIGYTYDEVTDKWNISDAAADYVFTGHQKINFALPGTLKVIMYPATWLEVTNSLHTGEGWGGATFPIFQDSGFVKSKVKSDHLNFVMIDCFSQSDASSNESFLYLDELANDRTVVFCLSSNNKNAMASVWRMFMELEKRNIKNPAIIIVDSNWKTADEHLIHYATEAGALLLDGFGDGVCFGMTSESYKLQATSYKAEAGGISPSGRTYSNNQSVEQFINNTAFSILQATRTRISKTEYISCPSCGRTLFDLQETTAKIRSVTNHLKGVKIAIMGCIVNGPGEMADADFGYVGSGPGKITLYKGKEIVKRNVPSEIAVEELINLLKENEAWVESKLIVSS
jgi:(E)-4-hydroxy-3-methylbut-2-enyl-diphosphate synthase